MQKDKNHKIDVNCYDFDKNIFIENDQDKKNLMILLKGINEIRHVTKVIRSDVPKRIKFYKDVHNLKAWIFEKTKFLDELINGKIEISIQTRCYWLIKGNKEPKLCKNPNCKTNISLTQNVVSITGGYRDYCCVKCVNNDPSIRQQICNTKEIKYGDKNYNNRDKAWDTTEKHFGVQNPFQAKEIKEKIVRTHQKRLSVDYPMQNKEVHAKSIKTLKEKFGVNYPLQNQLIYVKYKQTIYEKYKCINIFQVPKIRNNCQYKYTYKNIQFDSSNEIAYYIYLSNHNVKFEYQPNKSFKYEFENVVHSYIPDFYLIDQNLYVEIKGPHFFNRNGTMCNPYCPKNNHKKKYEDLLAEAKHQCMLKNNVKIIRTDSLEMQKIMNYIAEKYGKDYLKQFRNK